MTEIGKKLQLKPQSSLLLLNAPEQIASVFTLEGYHCINMLEVPHVGMYDAVQLFVRNTEELNHFVPEVIPLLTLNALFWIAYPKKSSGIKTDINRDTGWGILKELGCELTRLVSIDDTWSSARCRHVSERSKPSVFGIDLPGIDRKAKTVILPKDMQQALTEAGVLDAFNSLAFSHRREYTVAVMEAKRAETRAKRIGKAIEELKAKQRKV
jgi:hypothetical protein